MFFEGVNKHVSSLQLGRISGPPSPQSTSGTSGRVAAVCPYIQVPVPGRQKGGYTLPPDPLKQQCLTATVNHARSKSGQSFLLSWHLPLPRTARTGILKHARLSYINVKKHLYHKTIRIKWVYLKPGPRSMRNYHKNDDRCVQSLLSLDALDRVSITQNQAHNSSWTPFSSQP